MKQVRILHNEFKKHAFYMIYLLVPLFHKIKFCDNCDTIEQNGKQHQTSY